MVLAWHFTGKTLRDGSPIPAVGEVLYYGGHVAICKSGLHASRTAWDALLYSPGRNLHYVECDDIQSEQADKFVCRKRIIIQSHDVSTLLRRFACDCALKVLPSDAPDVVRQYLTTADESLRDAARYAAMDDAWYAAVVGRQGCHRVCSQGCRLVCSQGCP